MNDAGPPPPSEPGAFTLRQLQYAVAVADLLSFRKAAGRCHVSQPALSAQVAQLERALGLRLFDRDRRRVRLSAAGRPLVERARALLVQAGDLASEARQAADPMTGTLRVGVIPTVSPYLLPSIAPALRRAYAALTLAWVEEKTPVLVRRLRGGDLDAALMALEADVGDLDHEVIARDPFVLATPRGHPLGRSPAPASMRELREAPVLLLDDGHCFRDQALAFCAKSRAREMDFRATSLTTLGQMVASGVGVTLLPRLAVATEAGRSRLDVRPFAEPAPHRTIALMWRRRSPLAPALRRLASTIQKAYPNP